MAASNRPIGDPSLPIWLSTFVGRSAERNALHALLDGNRLVTLVGAGGSGKTRLAVEVAHDRADRCARGARFVDLTPLVDAGRIGPAIRFALGAHEEAGRAPVETVVDCIGDDPLLLVIDNCEHVLVGVAPFVEQLLLACSNLVVLATSREPLGIDGERTWLVPRSSSHPRRSKLRRWPPTTRSACSSTVPEPCVTTSRSAPLRRRRSVSSCGDSTACPSPSSWRRLGCR